MSIIYNILMIAVFCAYNRSNIMDFIEISKTYAETIDLKSALIAAGIAAAVGILFFLIRHIEILKRK